MRASLVYLVIDRTYALQLEREPSALGAPRRRSEDYAEPHSLEALGFLTANPPSHHVSSVIDVGALSSG